MPRKRKPNSFYIDTNIALDYATDRDIQTILVLERIKEKGWKCVSSTFLAMEMADYKKDYLFIEKAISKKQEVRKILREVKVNKLKETDLSTAFDWFDEFVKKFSKLQLFDFLQDSDTWHLAQDISFKSNLTAPDSIHLASAIVGAKTGICNILITKDQMLRNEAERIIKEIKLQKLLRVMNIADVKKKFFEKSK